MTARSHQLEEVGVGDRPEAWRDAGFAVVGDRLRIGDTVVVATGAPESGILSMTLRDVTTPIDDLPIRPTDDTRRDAASAPEGAHPNGVIAIDHVVVMSPDVDRTGTALLEAGLERRRVRRFDARGTTMRQEFFWMGDVILELVGEDAAHGEGAARLWGLALTAADLDGAADLLGVRLGPITPAVQPGRRIATVRADETGISVPVVLMSPHPGTAD